VITRSILVELTMSLNSKHIGADLNFARAQPHRDRVDGNKGASEINIQKEIAELLTRSKLQTVDEYTAKFA